MSITSNITSENLNIFNECMEKYICANMSIPVFKGIIQSDSTGYYILINNDPSTDQKLDWSFFTIVNSPLNKFPEKSMTKFPTFILELTNSFPSTTTINTEIRFKLSNETNETHSSSRIINLNCHALMLKAGSYIIKGTRETGKISLWSLENPPSFCKTTTSVYNSIVSNNLILNNILYIV